MPCGGDDDCDEERNFEQERIYSEEFDRAITEGQRCVR